ncbi:TIGR03089 family protein [Arthrobacter sp. H14-L1]|uniref:TIGR03089 family protein n=1 Tax=Arthrobacter sp. H14-L1 TaxID=2996697 RepID=UPI002271F3B8|nr:TIGR03089 family protein [Arthrobacter sp. H14-L1]MCY0904935.1 TIGR03089 family protein [Arthrobacter sp. H14-L1]
MPSNISTVPALLATLRTVQATSPRLTWYGPDGERVELSGKVLDNWVAKTANYVVDELDAGPGSVIDIDMPAHWRSLCWVLAAWQAGTAVSYGPGTAMNHDVTVTTTPLTAAPATEVPGTEVPAARGSRTLTVAVALGALEMRWAGDLPAGVLDYAAEVRAQGDVFVPFDQPSGSDVAVVGSRTADSAAALESVAFGSLFSGYAHLMERSERVLLMVEDGLETAVRNALGIFSAGGSVVLVHPSVAVTDVLLSAERITEQRCTGGIR